MAAAATGVSGVALLGCLGALCCCCMRPIFNRRGGKQLQRETMSSVDGGHDVRGTHAMVLHMHPDSAEAF